MSSWKSVFPYSAQHENCTVNRPRAITCAIRAKRNTGKLFICWVLICWVPSTVNEMRSCRKLPHKCICISGGQTEVSREHHNFDTSQLEHLPLQDQRWIQLSWFIWSASHSRKPASCRIWAHWLVNTNSLTVLNQWAESTKTQQAA